MSPEQSNSPGYSGKVANLLTKEAKPVVAPAGGGSSFVVSSSLYGHARCEYTAVHSVHIWR
jgi:hypothetical protein